MSAIDAHGFGPAGTWSLGLIASLALHAGAAALVIYTLQADPIPEDPPPRSELQIETQQVAQSQATEQAPEQTTATAASAKGAQLAEGAVRESRATPLPPPSESLAAAVPPADKLAEAAPPAAVKPAETRAEALPPTQPAAAPIKPAAAPGQTIAAAPPTSPAIKPAAAAAETVAAAPAPAETVTAAQPDAPPIHATTAPTETVTAAPPDAPAVKPVAALAAPVPASTATGPTLAAAAATGAALPEAAQPAEAAPQATPDAQPVAAAPAGGEHMTAALAWSGGEAQLDPQSLAAISSFMRPGDAAAQSDDVHDALTTLLTSIPCARLQAEFNPATGSMELRGHVPDEAMRGPMLKALQDQLGSGIKVADAMLILPSPQCGALSGLDNVGLPQSTDQNTNSKLIGADTQAVSYSYHQGQSFALDFVAPDYDAFLYIDYFDAGGQVIHLIPNDQVPLSAHPARSRIKLDPKNGTEPFPTITIGPPYGQEIAAAFAASAPLYDGLRPLSEPAGPYLDWLKARVSEARAKDPRFKGEWVYFFVSTTP